MNHFYLFTIFLLSNIFPQLDEKSLIKDIIKFDIELDNQLYLNQKYDNALIDILEQIENDKVNPDLYFQASLIYLKLDSLEQSGKYIKEAIKKDKANENYRKLWENIDLLRSELKNSIKSFQNGYKDDAIQSLTNAVIKFPDNAILYYNLGKFYYKNQDYDNAVRNYNKAIDLNPFNRQYQEAVKNISKRLTQKGKEEFKRREYEFAENYLVKALDYYENNRSALYYLGEVYLKRQKYQDALEAFNRGLAIDATDYRFNFKVAKIYQRNQDYAQAITFFNKVLDSRENYDKALYSIGECFNNQNDFDNAKSYLKRAILSNEKYDKAYTLLGQVYQKENNIELSIANYLLAVQYNKKSYDTYYRLANLYNSLQDYQQAKEMSRKSLFIKASYAPASYELGVAEKELGNTLAAIKAFKNSARDTKWRKLSNHEIDQLQKK